MPARRGGAWPLGLRSGVNACMRAGGHPAVVSASTHIRINAGTALNTHILGINIGDSKRQSGGNGRRKEHFLEHGRLLRFLWRQMNETRPS